MRGTPSTGCGTVGASPGNDSILVLDCEWDCPASPPWALFFVTFATASFGALIYTFALISEVLSDNGFLPSQVDFIYGCGVLGQYFGVIPGYLHDVVSPLCVATYATVAIILGYSSVIFCLAQHLCNSAPAQHGSVSYLSSLDASFGSWARSAEPLVCPNLRREPPTTLSLWMMGIGFLVLTQGGAALHYATMPTVLAGFPHIRRGLVSGVIASGYGISAFILSFLFERFFSPPEAPGVRPLILAFFAIIGGLMLILAMATIVSLNAQSPSALLPGSPSCASLHEASEACALVGDEKRLSQETVAYRRTSFTALEFEQPMVKKGGATLTTHLTSSKFMKHVYVQAVVQGGVASAIGSVTLLRRAQLEIGLDDSIWHVARLVRCVSLGNFMGRMCSGLLSQAVPYEKYNLFFMQAAIFVVVAQAAFLAWTPMSNALFVTCLTCMAFAMGVNFTIAPVWIMQTFSPKHVASLHSTAMAAVALSTFSFSILAGHEYEGAGRQENTNKRPLARADLVCTGPSCFRWWQSTHMLSSTAAAILSLYMGRD